MGCLFVCRMNSLKFILALLVVLASSFTFGQQGLSKYSLQIVSDTSIHDTITINTSYTSDIGRAKGFIKLKRVDTNYSIQVFWERGIDSSGFLVDSYVADTSYYVACNPVLNNLRNDFKKAKRKKILELTQWTYTFIIPGRENETFHDRVGLYLYHRLRYNSFLTF